MSSAVTSSIVIENHNFPNKARKRGRQKTTSVIGNCKKSKMAIIPFRSLESSQQVNQMLSWIITRNLDLGLIDKSEIKLPVSSKFANKEHVDITKIQPFFKRNAFNYFKKQLQNIKWICFICLTELDSEKSCGCDSCLRWFHLSCIKRTKPPHQAYFVCNDGNKLHVIHPKNKPNIFED